MSEVIVITSKSGILELPYDESLEMLLWLKAKNWSRRGVSMLTPFPVWNLSFEWGGVEYELKDVKRYEIKGSKKGRQVKSWVC